MRRKWLFEDPELRGPLAVWSPGLSCRRRGKDGPGIGRCRSCSPTAPHCGCPKPPPDEEWCPRNEIRQGDQLSARGYSTRHAPAGDTGDAETILEVEAWFRRRTDIEDHIREAKLGAALRKLPSGDQAANTVWMWAALLAGNLSTLLEALTGIDEHGRAHAARMRHNCSASPPASSTINDA